MKQGTAKVKCKCTHEVQDKMYGPNVRVMNSTAKQDKDYVDVRCTVCKAVHRVKPGEVK